MVECPACKFENSDDSDTCSKCGASLLESLGGIPTEPGHVRGGIAENGVGGEPNLSNEEGRVDESASLGDMQTISDQRDVREHQESPIDASIGDLKTISDEISAEFRIPDRFEILEELPRGGMGIVYRARDRKLGRTVALKHLRPDSVENKKSIDRFAQEAKTIASLNHFNIVQIYDVLGEEKDLLIVMEYVPGGTLEQKVSSDGALSPPVIREIGIHLCDALALAHKRGIYHRDIKPANILLTERGSPKLADFGLARVTEDAASMTIVGAQMGTMYYAAPEQLVSGSNVDARSDIYSLGATLYVLATKEVPRSIRLDRVPGEFRDVIGKCLEESPEKRYQTMMELQEALREEGAAGILQSDASCPKCGRKNPIDVRFCQECGGDLSSLFEKCPECGRENRVDIKYCGGCGANIRLANILVAARRASDSNRLDEAEELWRKAIDTDPGCKEAVDALKAIEDERKRIRAEAARKAEEARIAEERRRAAEEAERKQREAEEARERKEEEQLFGEIEASSTVRLCERYLSQYPKGRYIKSVQIKAEETRKAERHRVAKLVLVLTLMALAAVALGITTLKWNYERRKRQMEQAQRQIEAAAKQRQRQSAATLGVPVEKSVLLAGGVTMELVLIPAGKFMMGSDKGDPDEKPVHEATISKPFYMSKTEVTQAQYQAVMGSNPSYFKGDDLPVESVSWDDAVEFCEKLSDDKEGRDYRLPTEAEWEYACRGGTTTPFYTGGTISTEQANYVYGSGQKGTRRGKTTPVGRFPPNPFGLCDMHGNVWEWCSDWYDKNYYSKSPAVDPQGPATGSLRVVRGGSWRYNPRLCRSAYRGYDAPGRRYGNYGFRVVCSSSAGLDFK